MADLATPIAALLAEMDISLYDLEFSAGTLSVTVTRPGGIDLDTVAAANIAISQWLDETDPIAGRFTLDVSSPGLERTLRTPAHWAWAVGRTVSVKTHPNHPIGRRFAGTVTEATDTTVTIALDEPVGESVTLALGEIAKARTTFEWGPAPKPGGPKSKSGSSARSTTSPSTTQRDEPSSPDEEMVQS